MSTAQHRPSRRGFKTAAQTLPWNDPELSKNELLKYLLTLAEKFCRIISQDYFKYVSLTSLQPA